MAIYTADLLDGTKAMLSTQGNFWSRLGAVHRAAGLVVRTNTASQIGASADFVALAGAAKFGLVSELTEQADMTAIGPGGHETSGALAGTVASTADAVTGTGSAFLTDFEVGDVLRLTSGTEDGEGRRITAIADDTHLTLESAFSDDQAGTSYARGGEAPSTWYAVHVMLDPGGAAVDLLLSTREEPTLPGSYSLSSRIGWIYNDAAGDLRPFFQVGAELYWDSPVEILNHTADSGGWGAVGLVDEAPSTTRLLYLQLEAEVDPDSPEDVSLAVRRSTSDTAAESMAVSSSGEIVKVGQVLRGWIPIYTGGFMRDANFGAGATGTVTAEVLGYRDSFLAS